MASGRADFQRLAELRLAEAKTLAREGQFSGAYYVAGYAIECALKARIAAQFRENEIPDKSLVNRIYTHDLTELLRLAGLEAELDVARNNDATINRRWSLVKNWNEQARYSFWTKEQAEAIIDAIDGAAGIGGLFEWLSTRW
jgi:HEPN domain-containing protein